MKGLASWRAPRKRPPLLSRTPRPYSARLARFSTTPKRNVGLVELPTKLAADWTSATSSIGDAFLALPSQTGLSYTASLVAATLAIRLVVHLPVALWARSRTLRYQTSVLPALQMFMARLSRQRASKAEVMAWSTEKRATYGRLMTGKVGPRPSRHVGLRAHPTPARSRRRRSDWPDTFTATVPTPSLAQSRSPSLSSSSCPPASGRPVPPRRHRPLSGHTCLLPTPRPRSRSPISSPSTRSSPTRRSCSRTRRSPWLSALP